MVCFVRHLERDVLLEAVRCQVFLIQASIILLVTVPLPALL